MLETTLYILYAILQIFFRGVCYMPHAYTCLIDNNIIINYLYTVLREIFENLKFLKIFSLFVMNVGRGGFRIF